MAGHGSGRGEGAGAGEGPRLADVEDGVAVGVPAGVGDRGAGVVGEGHPGDRGCRRAVVGLGVGEGDAEGDGSAGRGRR